ncbi:hypothetical protein ACH5RR_029826 [Cinchona calisaya]|uniref:RNase H type-1 domain-containing protein n=1 Tax=Cinchona calisaya TaxID=153742 RepID=A0ABD2YSS2_9GENT
MEDSHWKQETLRELSLRKTAATLIKKIELAWKIFAVRWDGITEERWHFWKWWEKISAAGTESQRKEHVELTIFFLWQIWKHMNEWNFQGEGAMEANIVQRALHEWTKCKQKNNQGEKESMEQQARRIIWEREGTRMPQPAEMILEVKAEKGKNSNSIGTSIISWDRQENLIAVMATSVQLNRHPLVEKLITIREALIFAKDKLWT